MAITTAGGSGNADGANASLTLFTTPNTANAIFIVDIFVQLKSSTAPLLTVAAPTSAKYTMRVGPNTAVTVYGTTGTNYSYTWLSMVIT